MVESNYHYSFGKVSVRSGCKSLGARVECFQQATEALYRYAVEEIHEEQAPYVTAVFYACDMLTHELLSKVNMIQKSKNKLNKAKIFGKSVATIAAEAAAKSADSWKRKYELCMKNLSDIKSTRAAPFKSVRVPGLSKPAKPARKPVRKDPLNTSMRWRPSPKSRGK